MIICINYSDDGQRYIAHLLYFYTWSIDALKYYASLKKEDYDEVYVMAFNCNYKDLIEDIVLRGCRI